MNRTDEEEIVRAADLIRTWEWTFEDAEILYTFTVLDQLPLDKYPKTWAELREAFRNNEDLNHEWPKQHSQLFHDMWDSERLLETEYKLITFSGL